MKKSLIVRRDQIAEGLPLLAAGSLLLLVMLVAGCNGKPEGAGAHSAPPPEVGVFTVATRSLALTNDLPGRIDPVRIAQVRARVTGIVLHRDFHQGTNVEAGDLLYQIDPAPFQAAYDSAQAILAKAQANLKQAQQLADRYRPLVSINAVSKQDYDNAVSAAAQAKADVMAAKAALETADINLGYCKVTAPISGRIGSALVTEGALVSQTAATEMAVIQQMDPIYFDFTESSKDVLKLRQELESGQLKSLPSGEAKVTLTLPDGTIYPHPGKLLFSDITVDPTSGMITLRAEFPNPENWLLPGMFAMGRLEQAVVPQTILVPQRGVTIGANGEASVMLVTADNKAQPQPVQIGEAVGGNWIVKGGLKAGDKVIVDGLQKVRPGMEVKPVPASTIGKNSAAPSAGK